MSENSLITIETKDAFAVFTTENAIDPILAKVRAHIDRFEGDVSTQSGRKDIASMAYKVAQSKTYLEGIGKDLAAEAKAIPKKIDATRKRARDTLDEWRDEVRQPLTDWEVAEETRKQGHLEAIENIKSLGRTIDGLGNQLSAEELIEQLSSLRTEIIDNDRCEDFREEYEIAWRASTDALKAMIPAQEKREADALELEELRKAKAKQEAREREERERAAAQEREEELQRAAAERARTEAEAKAQAEIGAKEAAAQAEREEAEQRERKLQRAKEDAERRASEAKQRAEREIAEAQERERAAAKAREADREHRRSINTAAVDALVAGGIPKSHARSVVTLIAEGKVPNVAIRY